MHAVEVSTVSTDTNHIQKKCKGKSFVHAIEAPSVTSHVQKKCIR